GEDEVVAGRSLREARGERRGRVAQDAEIGDLGAEARQQRGDHHPVRVVDRTRRQRPAGLGELVAGGEHRHPQPPAHGQAVVAARGGERQVLGAQAPALRDDEGALPRILAARAGVGAADKARGQAHPVA
ncbi:hypothetical protein QP71_00105, partial [Staphylococcus aureus]